MLNKKTDKVFYKKDTIMSSKIVSKILIVTSLLCILLIVGILVMQQTININPQNPNKQIYEEMKEEEIGEDVWQFNIVMYDSAIEKGKKQLQEDTWNASTNETRVITIQINIGNANVVRTYNPGDLRITIDNLGKAYPKNAYLTDFMEVSNISADLKTSTKKDYAWSYEYDRSQQKYILTNNNTIEMYDNFQGTIQLSYALEARYLLNGSETAIKASLSTVVLNEPINSNTLKFNFNSTKREFTITKRAEKVSSYDGFIDGAQNYIWVRYYIDVTNQDDENVRGIVNNGYFYEKILDGCVLLDGNQKLVQSDENNYCKVPVTGDGSRYWTYDGYTNAYTYYYIGYPAQQYKRRSVQSETQWYGIIQDSYYYIGENKTEEMLAEGSLTVDLGEYETQVEKEYTIGKGVYAYFDKQSYHKIINPNYGEDIRYDFAIKATYMGENYNMRFGDDLIYITSKDTNTYRKLTDDEYYFKDIILRGSTWQNANKVVLEYNKYDMQLFVRYRGQDNFVKYGEKFKNTSSDTITFERTDIVGWYIEMYNLEESFVAMNNYTDINSTVHLQTSNNIAEDGKILNVNFLEVYKMNGSNEQYLMDTSEETYKFESRRLKIPEYDLDKYGHYRLRTEYNTTYGAEYIGIEVDDRINVSSEDNEYFYRNINQQISFNRSNLGTQKFNGYRISNVFPLGMELNATKEEIIDSITIANSNYQRIKKQDGTTFTKEEYINFIKQHTTINVDKNYKGTGQLWVEIVVDYHENPLNIFGLVDHETFNTFIEQYDIPLKISYESYFTNGATYQVASYTHLLNEIEEEYFPATKQTDKDDVDNDGDVSDYYMHKETVTATIVPAVSSYQEVNKSVWTENSENQWLPDVASVTYNGEYKYKLRVRTGINSIKNLVIYDNLETNGAWQGIFEGIDLQFANSNDYFPTVYYSKSGSAGTLKDDRGAWEEYDESVDKSTVKSLAFDYGDKIIPSGSITFVIIKMRAPRNVSTVEMSSNMCYTKWVALDIYGHEIDDMTGISSNVSLLAVPDSKENITVYKKWEDNENQLGLRPESIEVTLLQDGKVYEKATLSESTKWEHIFNVPVSDKTGKLYEYSVQEQKIDLYTSKIKNTDEDTDSGVKRSFTITNTLKEDEVYLDIIGKKTWEDEDNKKDKRPESITINLVKNGEVVETTTTNESMNWQYEFLKYPVWKNRTEKNIYEIKEQKIQYYTDTIEQADTNGLKIKFNPDCKTQNESYDFVEIYYNYKGTIYKAGKWGGNNLANLELSIPSEDFYLYWETNSYGDSYYGFSIDSIEDIAFKFDNTAIPGTLPEYEIQEIYGDEYPESAHGSYGNNINQIWHYVAKQSNTVAEGGANSEYFKIFNIKNTIEEIPAQLTDKLTKNGTEKITSKDEKIYYEIAFSASINDFEGKAKIKIVDTLPYPIDVKNSDLNEGKYEETTNSEGEKEYTITWEEEIGNINTFKDKETEEIRITKQINIKYIYPNLEEVVGNLNNKVQSTITLQKLVEKENPEEPDQYVTEKEDTKEAEVETIVEIPTKVIVHHYIYDAEKQQETQIKLADDSTIEGIIGKNYTTSPSEDVPANYICKNTEPDKNQGKMQEETIEVIYYYELIPPQITSKIDKIATVETAVQTDPNGSVGDSPQLLKEDGVVTYTIEYKTTVAKYIGRITVEIVDKLPAKIDMEKSLLGDGVYDEQNNTITWIEEIDGIDTFANESGEYMGGNYEAGIYSKEFVKEIKIVYKNQDVTKDIENTVIGKTKVYYPEVHSTSPGEVQIEEEATDTESVKQNYKVNLILTKVWEDNNDRKAHRPSSVLIAVKEKASGKETVYELNATNNWTYIIKGLPKYNNETGERIEYEITEREAKVNDLEYYESPKIVRQEVQTDEVTNYTVKIINSYKLFNTDLNTEITKEGTNEITSSADILNYTIHFTAEITDYIGSVRVIVEDTLPYSVDIEKSDLKDGEYEEVINEAGEKIYTIRWEEYLDHINVGKAQTYKIDITKDISVVYKELDAAKDIVTNKVKGRVELYETEQKDEKETTFDTNVNILGTVLVKHVDKDTQEEIAEQEVITNRVGREYTTQKKEIMYYEFIEDTGNSQGTIIEGNQEVIYYYIRPETKVIAKFQDRQGNTLSEDEIINGKVGDSYSTEYKIIENYILAEITGDEETGIMTKEPKEVIYIYEKIPTKIKVRYLEKDTEKELLPEEIIEGFSGDDYQTERKIIKNYKSAEPEPENKVGKMKAVISPNNPNEVIEDTIIVTYYYERIASGAIIVKYVDVDTEEEITYIEEHEDGSKEEKNYGYEIKGFVGDEYATTDEKIPYYDLIKAPDNASGELTEAGDTVIYYYKKKVFNFSIDKVFKKISLNGETKNIANNKLIKIEIIESQIPNAQLKVTYAINVSNVGEIDGKAKVVEMLPKGYAIENISDYWVQTRDGNLEAVVDLKAGETKELEITLKWINGDSNFGMFENIAKIVDTENDANFEETTDEDNTSVAELITSIKTGKEGLITIFIICEIMVTFVKLIILVILKRISM